MKKILTTLLIFGLLMAACRPSEQEQAQQQERQMQMQMQMQLVETTPEFKEQMVIVLERYFDVKNALVESDAEKAGEFTELLKSETENVDPAGLNEETLALWNSIGEVIINRSDELVAENDVDDQRYHFEQISETIIQMVDLFRPADYEIYHQSCPMVRDSSADWLSRNEEIANPYHGGQMMNCGEVIRKFDS